METKEKIRFEILCKKYFKFLEETFEMESNRDANSASIVYCNSTTAIRVNYEPRDPGMVYVLISRLINGTLPEDPIEITASTELHTFDLEDLISIRKPKIEIKRPSYDDLAKPFTFDVFENTLAQLANGLKECAKDIIEGDFTIFAELEKIVKQRAAT